MTSPHRSKGRGRLELDFDTDGDGITFLSHQFASYPFHVCKVQYLDSERPGLATLYTQSCSGGLYEGDDLSLEVVTRRQAQVHLTSQAATIIHSMTSGAACQTMHIVAEEDSYTEFLPDPQILFAESRSSSNIRVTAARSATVIISDAMLTHDPRGEGGGPPDYCSAIVIEDDTGRRLAADRLSLGPSAFSSRRPGVLGRYDANGTMLVVTGDPAAADILAKVRAQDALQPQSAVGITQLPNDAGYLCRVLADDGVSLKQAMFRLWCIVRQTLKGDLPSPRRK